MPHSPPWRRRRAGPLERFAGLSAGSSRGPDASPQRAGILEAFDTLTPSQLQVHRDAIAAALQGGQRVDEIALRTAARLRDGDLLEQVIDYAAPAIALEGIRQATQLHQDTVALEILGTAARRDEVASAALLQIGSIAARNDGARRLLLVALDDPTNSASAAAALASLHDPSVALQLGQQLSATSNDTTRRQRVLALKLDGSAEARAQLDRLPAGRERVRATSERGAPVARALGNLCAGRLTAVLLATIACGTAEAACVIDNAGEITNPFAAGCGDVMLTYTQNDNTGNNVALGYPVPQPIASLTPVDGFRDYASLFARHQSLLTQHDEVAGPGAGSDCGGSRHLGLRNR